MFEVQTEIIGMKPNIRPASIFFAAAIGAVHTYSFVRAGRSLPGVRRGARRAAGIGE